MPNPNANGDPTDRRGRRASGLRARLAAFVHPGAGYDEVVAHAPQLPLREVLRRFWPDARPYRRWLPLLVALIALGALIETAEIWAFKLVVDDVLIPGDLDAFAWIALAYLGLTLAGALISFADDYLATWIAERFLLSLRLRVLDHVQRLSLDVFNRHHLGDLVTRINSDVQQIETLVLSGVAEGLGALLRIVFFAGALFLLDWRLALVSLVVLPAFWLVAKHFSRLVKRASREKRRRVGSLSSIAEETFSNAPLIQATNSQAAVRERFRRQNEGVVEAELAASRIHGLFTPLVDLIELAGVLTVLTLGTLAVASGSLTIGGMLVFVAYLTQLYSPIRTLGSLSNTFFKALAGAERVLELLDERPRVSDRPAGSPAPAGARGGRARAISGSPIPEPNAQRSTASTSTWPQGRRWPWSAPAARASRPWRGCWCACTTRIEGRSGWTATTCASSSSPRCGATSRSCSRSRWCFAARWPRTSPSAAPTLTTPRSRPRLGRPVPPGSSRPCLAAMRSDIGERGRNLSGGQRQRIAIARVVLADAPVLVLDEPSTGLDAETRERLLEPLRALIAERTAIIVSHDLLTVRDADRLAVLDQGRLVELGSHDELLGAGGFYARLWELHSTERVHRDTALVGA